MLYKLSYLGALIGAFLVPETVVFFIDGDAGLYTKHTIGLVN